MNQNDIQDYGMKRNCSSKHQFVAIYSRNSRNKSQIVTEPHCACEIKYLDNGFGVRHLALSIYSNTSDLSSIFLGHFFKTSLHFLVYIMS